MKINYSQFEFDSAKSRDKLSLICEHCGKEFLKEKASIVKFLKGRPTDACKFCSSICYYNSGKVTLICKNCNKEFTKYKSQLNNNNFCSSSCAATYNNSNKKYGTRRSKLEIWLENQLSQIYSDLEIHFNRKDTINSELDIYIPSLKLAFELNGIFHYEPIFGKEKLTKIENNDTRKFQACLEKNIELCLINVSTQKYFKESTSIQYLNIICDIINAKINL